VVRLAENGHDRDPDDRRTEMVRLGRARYAPSECRSTLLS
jgi:hypothetical protein